MPELAANVKSILGITSSDFECIISDNNADPLTLKALFEVGDPRLKVVRPNRPLPMTDNFEFGAGQATGDWLLFLGSDDGVVASRFPRFAGLLDSSQSSVITGRTVGYAWPGVGRNHAGGRSWFQSSRDERRVVRTDQVRAYLRGRILRDALHPKATLPNPYMHGAIRRNAITRIRNRHGGRLFRTSTPDAFLSMAILHEEENYEVTDLAFGIQGVSPSSTGYTTLRDPSAVREAIQVSSSEKGRGAGFLPAGASTASVFLHQLECWATASGVGADFVSGTRDREAVIRTAFRFAWPQERIQLPSVFEAKWPDLMSVVEAESKRYESGGALLAAGSRWNGLRNRQQSLSAVSRGLAYLKKTDGAVLDTFDAASVVTDVDDSSTEQIHAGFFRWSAGAIKGIGIKAPAEARLRSRRRIRSSGGSP